MQPTTNEDRRRELRGLLDQISARPELPWTAERERVAVLQRMLGAKEVAKG